MKFRNLLLVSSAAVAVAPATAHAQDGAQTDQQIVVSAMALQQSVDETATPVIILTGEELVHRRQATLGETLAGLPGIHVDNFGGGASRPVIRGQTAPRVEVLSDSSSVQDASKISPDHAVVTEPLLLRGIEILRGPATLLYGGSAIGGAVNLLDDRVPTAIPERGITGGMEARAGFGDDERAIVGAVTAGTGQFAVHAEAFGRTTSNYMVPDAFGEDHVDGSYADSWGYSVGASWVGANGYLGGAYSNNRAVYGLPGHNHAFEECHPHGISLHCEGHDHGDDDHDHEEEHDHDHDHEEAPPFVNLRSERIDIRGEYRDLLPGIENVSLRYAYTDYEHSENEEDVVGTTFRNKAHDLRLQLAHQPIGPLSGVIGFQYSHSDFSADGEEAFLIDTKTRNTALFLVESMELGPVRLELAARKEWQKITHDGTGLAALVPFSSYDPFSFSGAAVWDVAPGYSLALSVGRSQRAPTAQELYAAGVHLATNTYEVGMLFNPQIGLPGTAEMETAKSIDLTLRKTTGAATFTLGVYHQDFDNYIYARTLDEYRENPDDPEVFRLISYTGLEATFTGIDGEATYNFSPNFAASIFGDYVRAKLKDDQGNLPRIPPGRLGARIEGNWGGFSVHTEYYHVFEQDKIASYETATPGYDMLNATIAYDFDLGDGDKVQLFVRGTNLTDELAYNHASFIKNAAPLRGRNVVFGVRTSF